MKPWSFLLCLLFSISAHAEIGNVVELSGSAVLTRAGKTIKIEQNTSVEMNDSVSTKSGKLKIKFKDDTTVTVTENSSLLIDDFVYSASSKSGKLSLKATAGTVRYVSGNIAHSNPNSVKINTPTASIAVRGTDFVMSVAETGSSMIILMPACETVANINLRGLVCGSGKILVESGGARVTLDKPYQATIVDTSSAVPSQPVVVNLDDKPVNNNLMISPPKTGSGANIVAAAKAAAEKTGDSVQATSETQQVAQKSSDQAKAQREDTAKIAASTLELSNKLTDAGIKISDVTENQYLYKIWLDKSQTQQTGLGYERVSPSGFNYTNIALAMDTKALVVVTQDMVTDAVNTNAMSSRSYGTIIVNQSYR